MTQQQRYIGPELSALLREVRSDLGDQAVIHEANRIRHGGVGGFFRKEGFEVVASPPTSGAIHVPASAEPSQRRRLGRRRSDANVSTTEPRHLALDDSLEVDDDLVAKLTAAMESDQAWETTIGGTAEQLSGSQLAGSQLAGSPPPPTIEHRAVRRFGPEDLAPIDDRIAPATMLLDPALTPGQALLDRAESISANERVGQLLHGASDLIDDSTILARTRGTSTSVAPRGLMDDGVSNARLSGLLHRTIESSQDTQRRRPQREVMAPSPARTTDTSPPPAASTALSSSDHPTSDRPTSDLSTSDHSTSGQRTTTRADGDHTVAVHDIPERRSASSEQALAGAESVVTAPTPTHRTPGSPHHPDETAGPIGETFWNDLASLEQVLPLRPTTNASIQLVVGPLDIALPLASRFTADSSIDLNILSDEVELVGVRADQMAESSRDLHQRLLQRSREKARAIGVVEADDAGREPGDSLDRMLPPRLLSMIDRVCEEGAVDLLRLTLRSLGPIDEVRDLVESFVVPCAIDLATAPTPSELDAALDAGLPIVSVAGRQLTPALAMALKHR